MGTSQSKPDPLGIYVRAIHPPNLPISVAVAEGPTLIFVFIINMFAGANLALFIIYLHLFGGRRSASACATTAARDPLLVQLAVALSVACNLILAFLLCYTHYQDTLIQLYTPLGYNLNVLGWYVPVCHILSALPDAIGQLYFAYRFAKLFDASRINTKIGVAAAVLAITVQFTLMVWFGFAFFSLGHKTALVSRGARHLVRSIIVSWTVLFILLEITMTSTTLFRLLVLKKHATSDPTKKIIINLAIYSLQGQTLLTLFSLTSVYLFQTSESGWYAPLYLCSGALYSVVLQANLIYRAAVSSAIRQSQSQDIINAPRTKTPIHLIEVATRSSIDRQ